MPSFPLPRFLETEVTRVEHARQLERVAREVGGDVRATRPAHTAADTRTLRGIPAVGRGVAGVIAGTQPEAVLVSASRSSAPP